MNTINLSLVYALIAAAVAAHVFHYAVLSRPRVKLFSLSDLGILLITSLAVGAVWLLFVPSLIALFGIRAAHWLRTRAAGWTITRAQHARARS